MLLFDPILCTDPAKIVNFQTEYFAVVQQSVTLNCEADGNLPLTYTWIPCDPEQVCNKKTLDISQVLNDASYTCRVANVHGPDTKTAIVCKFYCSSICIYSCSFILNCTNMTFWLGSKSLNKVLIERNTCINKHFEKVYWHYARFFSILWIIGMLGSYDLMGLYLCRER